MKNTGKIFLVKALFVVAVVLFTAFAFTFNVNEVKPTVAEQQKTFFMSEEIQARVSNPSGLRFRVYLDEQTKAEVMSADQFGFIISPTVNFEHATSTNYLEEGALLDKAVVLVSASDLTMEEQSGLYFINAVLYNIRQRNWYLDFSAVAYYKTGDTVVYTYNEVLPSASIGEIVANDFYAQGANQETRELLLNNFNYGASEERTVSSSIVGEYTMPAHPIGIQNQEQFVFVMNLPVNTFAYELLADITLTDKYIDQENGNIESQTNTFANEFAGVLDGNGNVATFNIDTTNVAYYWGVFRNISGTIKNTTFVINVRAPHNGSGERGLLTYRLYGTVENCIVNITNQVSSSYGYASTFGQLGENAEVKNTVINLQNHYTAGGLIAEKATATSKITNVAVISNRLHYPDKYMGVVLPKTKCDINGLYIYNSIENAIAGTANFTLDETKYADASTPANITYNSNADLDVLYARGPISKTLTEIVGVGVYAFDAPILKADGATTISALIFSSCTSGNLHDFGDWVTVTAPTCVKTGLAKAICKVCGAEKLTTIDATGIHTEDEAVKENEVTATCTANGSYESVVYCSVCGEELTRETVIVTGGHTPKQAVHENEITATCAQSGAYDLVVYCSVCDDEISRSTIEVPKKEHTAGEKTEQNRVEPTCIEKGSYDQVIWCSACEEEFSRTTIEIPELGHKPDSAVEENRTEADCKNTGSYDLVVYCSVSGCGEQISRKTIIIPTIAHTPAAAVEQNRIEPTCKQKGSYDLVVNCSSCGELISKNKVEIPMISHTAGDSVEENFVSPTCTEKGSYDLVVHCVDCGVVMSKKTIEVRATGHTSGSPKTENFVPTATCDKPASLDVVVNCTVCGEEISRETMIISPALGHNYEDTVVPPTETTEGYTLHKCSTCGDEYIDSYVPVASQGLSYTLLSDDTYEVSGIGTCTDTDIVIPATYNGKAVTSIGYGAFAYCSNLTSITIPASVTTIAERAFYSCDNLTIYCEAESQPSGWSSYWNYSNCPVYWAGEWEYVDGIPTPKN